MKRRDLIQPPTTQCRGKRQAMAYPSQARTRLFHLYLLDNPFSVFHLPFWFAHRDLGSSGCLLLQRQRFSRSQSEASFPSYYLKEAKGVLPVRLFHIISSFLTLVFPLESRQVCMEVGFVRGDSGRELSRLKSLRYSAQTKYQKLIYMTISFIRDVVLDKRQTTQELA